MSTTNSSTAAAATATGSMPSAGSVQSFANYTPATFFSSLITALVVFAVQFVVFLIIREKLPRL